MATISQGSNQLIDIAIGDKYQVTTRGEAAVDIVAGVLGAGSQSHRVTVDRPRTFGPYGAVARIRVRAITEAAVVELYVDPQPARLIVDPIGGTAGVGTPEGKRLPVVENSMTPIMVAGGDHPYAQWWGANGRDGMAEMYFDQGVKPYIAVCADESPPDDLTSGTGATLGKVNMMSYEQARELQRRGAEFISHGGRHINYWESANTGVRIYYSGASATPTVNIDAVGVTLAHAGGTTQVTFAAAPTVAQLVTAIAAVPGWKCIPATELTGAEESKALLPLKAARSVVADNANDPMRNNQRFALSGGIRLQYTGREYQDMYATLAGNFLQILADGRRVATVNVSAQSLAETVAAVHTAMLTAGPGGTPITGVTALVMDNGFKAQNPTNVNKGQKFRETYCYGDEKSSALWKFDYKSMSFESIAVEAGLGYTYTIDRLTAVVIERCAAEGIVIRNFAQSGGRFYQWSMRSNTGRHGTWRGDRSFTELRPGISPHAVPAAMLDDFTPHFTAQGPASASPYSEGDIKAIYDALVDSGPFYIDQLNHLLSPSAKDANGVPIDPSGWNINQHTTTLYESSADQDEGPFWRELQRLGELIRARKIDVCTPDEARRLRSLKRMPHNLIFNPKFRTSRADLLGVTTPLQGAGGIAVPGWAIAASTTDFTKYRVVDGVLEMATNGAVQQANVKEVLGANLMLEAGKTYVIGAKLDLRGMTGSSSARFVLYPMHGPLSSAPTLGSLGGPNNVAGSFAEYEFMFSVPAQAGPTPARIVSLPGPFDLSAGNTIRLALDNIAAIGDIALTGANPAAVTAKEAAAAINAFIAASPTYATREEYHNVARAEGGKLIIESPKYPGANNLVTEVTAGTNPASAVAMTALYGASPAARAVPRLAVRASTPFVGYRLALVLESGLNGELKLSNPYCKPVRY